jgi:hypothetical protein
VGTISPEAAATGVLLLVAVAGVSWALRTLYRLVRRRPGYLDNAHGERRASQLYLVIGTFLLCSAYAARHEVGWDWTGYLFVSLVGGGVPLAVAIITLINRALDRQETE